MPDKKIAVNNPKKPAKPPSAQPAEAPEQSPATEDAWRFIVNLPRTRIPRRSSLAPAVAERLSEAEMIERLRRFEMFEPLPDAILKKLAKSASIQVYRAGDRLWNQGEPNERVVFIEQGLAKTARRTRGGDSRTFGLYGPGDSMGIYAIWAGMKYPTDAWAMSDGMAVIQLDPLTLLQCAEKQARLSVALMAEISRFTEALVHKIEIVGAGSISERVAALMVMLVDRYGIEVGEGKACLPVYLTLEQIGEIVDSRLETVNRVLVKWKRQGWLTVNTSGYHFLHFDNVRALLPEFPA